MKTFAFTFCLIFQGVLLAQNWNVFNKSYRYNYKYNNSVLVSNVLFVDTVKQAGTDTIYTLNRIGVECTGSCPTITTALTPTVTYIVPNMPQFLQRCIRKYSNGLVKLYDTTKIVIIPTCSLSQTWLFDSVYNKSATCINSSTQTIFGNIDSVKTILIDGVDTLKLSKSFGIILFPDIYAKNKYYRLVGIEKNNSYDQTSLFGEKVPNAWDFYNYDVGDVMCSEQSHLYTINQPSWCYKIKQTVTGKSVSVNGFNYNMNTFTQYVDFFTYAPGICTFPPQSFTTTYNSGSISISGLSSNTLVCNLFYPNMIYPSEDQYYMNPNVIHNIVKYGSDNTGRFYKYCGPSCASNPPPIMPNTNAITGCTLNNNGLFESFNYGETTALTYGVGFGLINETYIQFETFNNFCLTSFIKNNVTYFGPPNPIGMEEHFFKNNNFIFGPNPANNEIDLHLEGDAQVKILNTLGQTVFNSLVTKNHKIDTKNFENGIYLLYISNSSLKGSQKLIIQH